MVSAQDGGGEEILQQPPQYAELGPTFSEDGFIIDEPVQRLVLVADENPTKQSAQIPLDQNIDLSVKGASFDITYVSAGGSDRWGEQCLAFPIDAMTAFNYAANIWAATISSNVPITVRACWANLGSSSILGYSGGYYSYRDFPGAEPNTWYASSLANAILGFDNDTSKYDMHITYNTNFSWYFGTDAKPASGTMDFVTVAAHEIAHGLNFSGTADYYYEPSLGNFVGSYGGESPYPNIYDRYMRDGSGTLLTSYTNPSTALGGLLTSNNLWFHGSNAMAANGSSRVKMYTPTTWSGGSSYSHLEYDTFKTPNINSMMVYAISSGTANHNPGPVTIGLLKDLGWNLAAAVPTSVAASDGTYADKVVVSWDSAVNATYYQVFRSPKNSPETANQLITNHVVTNFDDTTAEPGIIYHYWVKACSPAGCSDLSLSDEGWKGYTVIPPPSDVLASDGEFQNKVRITWNRIGGAESYKVFRNFSDTTIGVYEFSDIITGNSFDDFTAALGNTYYYWIQACNNSGCSEYSASDSGYVQSMPTSWNIYLPLLNKNYAVVDPIKNGDFELGRDGSWTEYSSNGYILILTENNLPIFPKSGDWAVWLGDDIDVYGEISRLSQDVSISSSSPYLHFWYEIFSDDLCSIDYDAFKVKINGATIFSEELCYANNTIGWTEKVINLSAYSGSSVTLLFEVITDNSLFSSVFLDDVSMSSVSTVSTAVVEEMQVMGDVTSRKVK